MDASELIVFDIPDDVESTVSQKQLQFEKYIKDRILPELYLRTMYDLETERYSKPQTTLENVLVQYLCNYFIPVTLQTIKAKKFKNALSKAVNNKQKQNEVAQKRIEKAKQEQQVKQNEGLKTFLSSFSQFDKLQTYRL